MELDPPKNLDPPLRNLTEIFRKTQTTLWNHTPRYRFPSVNVNFKRYSIMRFIVDKSLTHLNLMPAENSNNKRKPIKWSIRSMLKSYSKNIFLDSNAFLLRPLTVLSAFSPMVFHGVKNRWEAYVSRTTFLLFKELFPSKCVNFL